MTRRLASTPAFARGPPCATQGGIGSQSHLLHGHIQDVSLSSKTAWADDEGFLLAGLPT